MFNKFAKSGIVLLIFTSCLTSAFAQSDEEIIVNTCIPCSEIRDLRLPNVVILEATEVNIESSDSEITGRAHCKILGRIDKEINFELLLPLEWNGRFAMGGGGGFVGSIQNMMAHSINLGFATAGTDTGHQGHGLKADWALNNMERQLNFGHAAIHKTAEVSKVLIFNFYCADPEYSYFLGCSRGGGQGMMEAQRYPEDFDGIVSMAPAFDWPAIAAEFIQNSKALYPDPENLNEPLLTKDNQKLLQEAVLEACDAVDGLKDGIITDPRDCDFDPEDLPKCAGSNSESGCFTEEQIRTIKTIYAGVTVEDRKVYPGFPLGGENRGEGWNSWIVGPEPSLKSLGFPSLQFGFGTEMFKYLVYNDPEWDYSTYNYENFWKDTEYAASYLNATNPDYSAFKNSGGKILFTHGWEDPALSALATIDHFENILGIHPDADAFTKLYLLPGVLHCDGGPGPSDVDWLTIIRNWVENGEAPGRIIANKVVNDKVVLSRPVFPYPRKAVYDGQGDPNLESSFK
jgi:feruloyl esterase